MKLPPCPGISFGQGGDLFLRKTLPIFYNALILTAVHLLLRFVSTTFQVHISSRIGAEGVGLLQLVMSVGGLAMTAGMAGIRTATMYLSAEELGRGHRENVGSVLRGCLVYSILFSSAVSLGVYWGAPYIASYWIGNTHTVGAIRLYACFLPLICMSGCMTGYFTAANRITTLAVVEIAEQLCYMGVTMITLQFWTHTDPEKACQAVVFGAGISSCLTLSCLLVLRAQENPPAATKMPIRGRLCRIAIPLALADDLKAGISTTENLMVPKRLAIYEGELSPLATFGTVTGMVFPVLMFPAAILYALAELLIPELARCAAAGSNMRIRYLVRRGLKVALLYGCVSGGILYLCAKPLCLSLYSSPDAGEFLQYYSLLAPMLYCDAITDAMVKGLGQQTASVRYNILTSAMDVTFLFLLLPEYGMGGYFVSFLVTHLINFALSLRRLLKITRIRIPFSIPALTCAGCIIAASLSKFSVSTVGKVVSFLPAVGSIWVLFGVLGKRDLHWLRGLLLKK